MKISSFKRVLTVVFFLVALLTCVVFAMPLNPPAEAAAGTVTVAFDGEKYLYTDADGGGASDDSLQNVIDYAEKVYSQPIFSFELLPVRTPLSFKKNSLLQGTLTFELTSNDYALTVKHGATVVMSGLSINSNRSAVKVEYGGNLELRSGTIAVSGCDSTCSAIDVRGNALISGGRIIYSEDNKPFGYGLSVNGNGSLTVTPEAPVIIEGHSGLCLASGRATVNGGRYIANNSGGNSSAGYSVDVQDGELTINDGEFPQPIYARTVASGTIDINGGNLSSLRVPAAQNSKLNIGSLEIFSGTYCELNITFPTGNTVSVSGKKSNAGFRTVGFTVDNIPTYEPVLTVSADEEKTVVPIENDLYCLNLSCDGSVYKTLSYAYGTTVNLQSLPAPEKIGYSLSGWVEAPRDFTLIDDVTLNAVTVLSDTEISITGTELVYDGSVQTITPVLEHDLKGVAFETYWERFAQSGWEKISDGNDLKVTAVSDGGEYRCTVIARYGDDESITAKDITVTVNRGKYANVTHPDFSGTYNPDKSLTGYTLQQYFKWANATTVPTVPVKYYSAIYNADPANYENFELDIKVDLAKAAAVTAPPHPDVGRAEGYAYEKKQLKEYPLREGFSWKFPDEIPVAGETVYALLYAPDPDNYEFSTRHISFYLEKGSYDKTKRLDDITITYRPDYYLSDFDEDFSKAHANYLLKFTSDRKLNADDYELDCIYNDDPTNYFDFAFTFVLTVQKAAFAAADVPPIEELTGVYSGLPLSEYALPNDVFWSNPDLIPTVAVREYAAFYNSDRDNYFDYPITVTVTLKKGSYDINSVTVPMLEAVTYNKDAKLSDIALPAGWSWKDPSVIPTVAVTAYRAEYCDDSVNYLPLSVSVPLTVEKASITTAVLPDATVTYDGKEHYLEFDSLPYPLVLDKYENNGKVNAGQYEVTAKLIQTDVDNYCPHPATVRGTLTILKAASVITAPARYDVSEGKTISIEGSVENDEQNLIIPEFNETAVGVYSVTLTTAESGNYLAGSFTVTVSINKTEKYVGNIKYPSDYDGSYLYGILKNSDCGVPNDAEVLFRPFSCDDFLCGMEISVIVDGNPYVGKFTAKIRMTDEMLSASALVLYADDGTTEVAFTVENGVYLVFETDGSDVFYLKGEFDKKFAWYWIPIGIVLGLIAIGAILMVLWKKGILKLSRKATPPETDAAAVEPQAEAAEVTATAKEQKSEENDLERE